MTTSDKFRIFTTDLEQPLTRVIEIKHGEYKETISTFSDHAYLMLLEDDWQTMPSTRRKALMDSFSSRRWKEIEKEGDK